MSGLEILADQQLRDTSEAVAANEGDNLLDSSRPWWDDRYASERNRFPASPLVAYRIKRDGPLRVPDLLLNSIGFVAEVLGPDLSVESLDPIATAFVVSVPSEGIPSARYFYAVTATHVFKTPGARTVIIVNKKGGGVTTLTLFPRWFRHPDKNVDVAVTPIAFDPTAEVSGFDAEDFFDETRNSENVGPGDEVFFPGLFTPAPGIERIIPMVRHGNVAMIPRQQIQTGDGYTDLYLVEARSIGGLSGSPVFVRETVVLPVARHDETKAMMHGLGKFKLLGLIQGHWDVDESKINQAHVSHDPKRGVNMGIAKVVPSKKILETINAPEIRAIRDSDEVRWLKENASSLD